MKKFNFFKKPAPPATDQKQPEVETAIVIVQYENGGASVGYLNVQGIKMKRPATMKDMFRMVSEVKAQLETIQTADRLMNILGQIPGPMVQPPVPQQPIQQPVEKAEEKKEEGYAANAPGNPETPVKPEPTA